MKLAIIGSSPIALEAALRFHAHGAALTWFSHDESDFAEGITSLKISWTEFTSDLGWKFLKKSQPSGEMTWVDWQEQYAGPLLEILSREHPVRFSEVASITKRFLRQDEEISGKSRFHDLFRLIYLVNPEEFIARQKEANPETYERLTSELVNSLQRDLEMYEDFDLVLDLRHSTIVDSLAETGRALGESRVAGEKVHYGQSALKRCELLVPEDPAIRELILVGSGPLAAEVLLRLSPWLQDERNRLFLVTTEEDPFSLVLSRGRPDFRENLGAFFHRMDVSFQVDKDRFHQKLRDWQALDEFVQVKYPKPTEPIPRLVYFSGHNATAVDRLIDRERLFVTLEKPDFREGVKQPENNLLELKTIGVDEILVATSGKRSTIAVGLREKETGHFGFQPTEPVFTDGWSADLATLRGIEDEIFKLFSPAASH